MKQEITGYITGIINNYNRIIEDIKKRNNGFMELKYCVAFVDGLNDLLDFVQDIPEEKREPKTVDNGVDIERIKSYARKLEKINIELRLDNISWQKKCKELKFKKNREEK